MLDRGAARPSTAPGPGPRAGRCAAAAPRTANARRDPGPIVGSLRRLGWGGVHDASRPGGSGAGTARRVPSTGILRPDATRVQPRVLLATQELATFTSRHHAKLCALPPLFGLACHPEGRRRADDSAGQTVVQPRKGPGLRRPHPKLGCVQTRQAKNGMDVSAGQGLVVGLPGLEPGTSS